eukprot:TRINITY_DN11938_c3_g1_i4.p1 TRINITY_DN11938_c3_g1~~TRINITY_DN11938_c3_g1_i4.p1  ORF type:complete len:739 (+),score=215.76 TRINITY_DN11938_c3_g1_i4:306-2219(+)
MSNLIHLDELKTNMEATRDAVMEADNWSKLSADVDNALRSDDIHVIAAALLGMQRSMLVLGEDEDLGSDRQTKLQQLKARLKGLLRPQMAKAVEDRDLQAAQSVVVVYKDMMQEHEALQAACEGYKNDLQLHWQPIATLADSSSSHASKLQALFDRVSSTEAKDTIFFATLFGHDKTDVQPCSQAVQFAVTNLRPSLTDFIADAVQGHQAHPFQLSALDNLLHVVTDTVKSSSLATEAWQSPLDVIAQYQLEWGHVLTEDVVRAWNARAEVVVDDGDDEDDNTDNSVPRALSRLCKRCQADMTSACDILRKACQLTSSVTQYGGLKGLQQAITKLLSLFNSQLFSNISELPDLYLDAELAWTQSIGSSYDCLAQVGHLIATVMQAGEEARHGCVKARHYLLEPTGAAALVHKWDYFTHHTVAKEQFLPLLQACTQGQNPFVSCVSELESGINQLHQLTVDVNIALLKDRLKLHAAEIEWSSLTLADHQTFPPTSQVSRVGELLLMLPQHLEVYLEDDSKLLTVLQYCTLNVFKRFMDDEELDAGIWLDVLAQCTCDAAVESIATIKGSSNDGRLQLSADIEYFCNVVTALDTTPSSSLFTINRLLLTDASEYKAQLASIPRDLEQREIVLRALKQLR